MFHCEIYMNYVKYHILKSIDTSIYITIPQCTLFEKRKLKHSNEFEVYHHSYVPIFKIMISNIKLKNQFHYQGSFDRDIFQNFNRTNP